MHVEPEHYLLVMILTFNNQWLIYDAQVFDNFAEAVRYVYTGPNVTATPTSGVYDDEITLTHSTPQGYDFVDYVATGANIVNNTFTIGDTDVYVEGVFTEHYYTISTSSSHGSISASYNTAKHGTIVTLSNAPATGYDFDYYEVVGATLFNDNQFIVGYSDITVIGHFKQHKYTVTVQSTNGSVTASPSEGVHGTTVTLSNTPAAGYAFDYYEVTGATLNNNKFVIGYSDVTVIGHFKSAVKHATVHLRLPDVADTYSYNNKTWYPIYVDALWEVVSYTGDDISYLTKTAETCAISATDAPFVGTTTHHFSHNGTTLDGSKTATIKVYASNENNRLRARSNVRNGTVYIRELSHTTGEYELLQVYPLNTQDAAGSWNYERKHNILAVEQSLSDWLEGSRHSVGFYVDGNTYCFPNPYEAYKDVIADLTWTE